MSHTPGPWEARDARGKSGEWLFFQIVPTQRPGARYRGDVASVSDAEHIDGITVGEAAANALLIVSAPALLRGLKHAAELLTLASDTARTVDADGERFDLLAEAEFLDTLIAAATTGEQA